MMQHFGTFTADNQRFDNRITRLFGIDYPIIQAGMIWASGWKLASAVSNAGGLGLIGAGSMYPEVLEEHLLKCKAATDKPFGVNLPLLYPDIDRHIELIIKHRVPIVLLRPVILKYGPASCKRKASKWRMSFHRPNLPSNARMQAWMPWWQKVLRQAATTDGRKQPRCA